MHRTHRLLLAIASAGGLLLPAPAGASQASTSFQVTATVGAACTLSAPDLAFGTYTTGSSTVSQTTITVDCGTVSPVGTLTLTGATTGGTSPSGFAMTQAGGVLNYDLFRDAAHTQLILQGQSFPGPLPGATPVIDIFGEIPAGQSLPDGPYSDTVSVVFNF